MNKPFKDSKVFYILILLPSINNSVFLRLVFRSSNLKIHFLKLHIVKKIQPLSVVGVPCPSNSVQRDHSCAWRGSRSDKREALTVHMKRSAALQVCIQSSWLRAAKKLVLSYSFSPQRTLQYWRPPHHCAPVTDALNSLTKVAVVWYRLQRM